MRTEARCDAPMRVHAVVVHRERKTADGGLGVARSLLRGLGHLGCDCETVPRGGFQILSAVSLCSRIPDLDDLRHGLRFVSKLDGANANRIGTTGDWVVSHDP